MSKEGIAVGASLPLPNIVVQETTPNWFKLISSPSKKPLLPISHVSVSQKNRRMKDMLSDELSYLHEYAKKLAMKQNSVISYKLEVQIDEQFSKRITLKYDQYENIFTPVKVNIKITLRTQVMINL